MCVGGRKSPQNSSIHNENIATQLTNMWASVVPQDRGGFGDDIIFGCFSSGCSLQDCLKRFELQKHVLGEDGSFWAFVTTSNYQLSFSMDTKSKD